MQGVTVFDIPYVFTAYEEKLAYCFLVICPAAKQFQNDEPGAYDCCASNQGIVTQALWIFPEIQQWLGSAEKQLGHLYELSYKTLRPVTAS